MLFGEQENTDWNKNDIDWNKIDSQLVSQKILITKPEINGKKLGSLHLRNDFGVNTTRIYRGGISILARPQLRLQLGDRLIVVGDAKGVKEVSEMMGSSRTSSPTRTSATQSNAPASIPMREARPKTCALPNR